MKTHVYPSLLDYPRKVRFSFFLSRVSLVDHNLWSTYKINLVLVLKSEMHSPFLMGVSNVSALSICVCYIDCICHDWTMALSLIAIRNHTVFEPQRHIFDGAYENRSKKNYWWWWWWWGGLWITVIIVKWKPTFRIGFQLKLNVSKFRVIQKMQALLVCIKVCVCVFKSFQRNKSK